MATKEIKLSEIAGLNKKEQKKALLTKTFYCSPELNDRLVRMAANKTLKEGKAVSVSAIIVEALMQYLEKDE